MLSKEKILQAAVIIARRKKSVMVTRAELAKRFNVSAIAITYHVKQAEIYKYLFKELTR